MGCPKALFDGAVTALKDAALGAAAETPVRPGRRYAAAITFLILAAKKVAETADEPSLLLQVLGEQGLVTPVGTPTQIGDLRGKLGPRRTGP